MNRRLPNQLTASRLPLAAGFFVLIGLYTPHSAMNAWWLNAAMVVFVVAGVTDFLDGYLARRMNVTSAFGRIVDPFLDKVLVVGAFVMLAGSNYVLLEPGAGASWAARFEWNLPRWVTGRMASAVQPWMVVTILAREFIVSAVRGYSESCGVKFPATYAGKIKIIVQLSAIGTILVQLGNLGAAGWAICLKIAMVWLAVVVTVVSGLAYVGKARGLLQSRQ